MRNLNEKNAFKILKQNLSGNRGRNERQSSLFPLKRSPRGENYRHSSAARDADAIGANYAAHFTTQMAALRGICRPRSSLDELSARNASQRSAGLDDFSGTRDAGND